MLKTTHKKQPVKYYTQAQINAHTKASYSAQVAASTTKYHAQNKRSTPVSNAQYMQKKLNANKQAVAANKAKQAAHAQHLNNVLNAQTVRLQKQQAQQAAQRKIELAAMRKAKRAAVKANQVNNVSKLTKSADARVKSVARIVKTGPSAHYMHTLVATNKLRAKINLPKLSVDEFCATYRRYMRNCVTCVALTNNVVVLSDQRLVSVRAIPALAA
ncbi:hypothetical protein [Magnetovibrio blakemorei]|uniref:Uncharacterized protein n=1 Tax=Magnetovibrio blakemorei TaxID=28181 RepID=A0A1E5Q6Y7_9PROT|nr:hypothetical protein [Magnetovibrio blakemorei]OEJ66813.1 hypothetical protein BEN30_11320 [Magnetovibrio blakemorei]